MLTLIKVLVAFALILVLLRYDWKLGYAMLVGALALAVLSLLSPVEIVKALAGVLVDKSTIELALILILVIVFSDVLRTTGALKRITGTFGKLVGDIRIVISAMPAFIGLLPMPGGAVFSAPMVEAASKELNISKERKAFINYWFRHVWEYVFPLYPGLILTSKLTDVELPRLILVQLPLTFAAIASGSLIGLRQVPQPKKNGGQQPQLSQHKPRGSLLKLAVDVSPIVLVLVLALLCKLHLIIAIISGIIATLALNKVTSTKATIKLLLKAISINAILLIVGIMSFRKMMEVTGTVSLITSFFTEQGIPVIALIIAVPFFVGIITGLTIAFVGIVYPIIIPLFATAAGHDATILLYVMLAFASGFVGVLLSPVHLCLILTKGHFQADITKIYKMLIPAAVCIFVTALVVFLIFT